MKKTRITATIGQLNPTTGEYTYTDHKVYKDECDRLFAIINGQHTSVFFRNTPERTITLSYPIRTH